MMEAARGICIDRGDMSGWSQGFLCSYILNGCGSRRRRNIGMTSKREFTLEKGGGFDTMDAKDTTGTKDF